MRCSIPVKDNSEEDQVEGYWRSVLEINYEFTKQAVWLVRTAVIMSDKAK